MNILLAILASLAIIITICGIALALVRFSDQRGWIDPTIRAEHPGLFKREG